MIKVFVGAIDSCSVVVAASSAGDIFCASLAVAFGRRTSTVDDVAVEVFSAFSASSISFSSFPEVALNPLLLRPQLHPPRLPLRPPRRLQTSDHSPKQFPTRHPPRFVARPQGPLGGRCRGRGGSSMEVAPVASSRPCSTPCQAGSRPRSLRSSSDSRSYPRRFPLIPCPMFLCSPRLKSCMHEVSYILPTYFHWFCLTISCISPLLLLKITGPKPSLILDRYHARATPRSPMDTGEMASQDLGSVVSTVVLASIVRLASNFQN